MAIRAASPPGPRRSRSASAWPARSSSCTTRTPAPRAAALLMAIAVVRVGHDPSGSADRTHLGQGGGPPAAQHQVRRGQQPRDLVRVLDGAVARRGGGSLPQATGTDLVHHLNARRLKPRRQLAHEGVESARALAAAQHDQERAAGSQL